ncbi:HalOD1 output domain-containing protein [Halosolutus amylolyticus]|uniref:HalOD1 output domain-containing protein n=1 Tax=Halosolutus amylolyticus TaxID=2932267 RepID=A0ABD5PRN8_9EURY|nr:HalOD1 output domain-containing protein [Halosolutus amylolyticus]
MAHNNGLSRLADADDRTSMRIIEAVSTAQRVSPDELELPLYDVVDPEALDRLFDADPATDLRVSFEYADHTVQVRSGGRVSIDGVGYDPGDDPERSLG